MVSLVPGGGIERSLVNDKSCHCIFGLAEIYPYFYPFHPSLN
jgi:hypothetical protein